METVATPPRVAEGRAGGAKPLCHTTCATQRTTHSPRGRGHKYIHCTGTPSFGGSIHLVGEAGSCFGKRANCLLQSHRFCYALESDKEKRVEYKLFEVSRRIQWSLSRKIAVPSGASLSGHHYRCLGAHEDDRVSRAPGEQLYRVVFEQANGAELLFSLSPFPPLHTAPGHSITATDRPMFLQQFGRQIAVILQPCRFC